MDAGADCVDGQVGDQADEFSEGRHEEREDQLPPLVLEVLVHQLGYFLVALVIDGYVQEGWDEGCRERQLDPAEQLKPVILDGGEGEGDGVVADILAGLEARGDRVDGVEEGVAQPVPAGRNEGDLD